MIEKLRGNFFANLFTVYLRLLIGGAFALSSIRKVCGLRFTKLGVDDPIGAFFEALYQTGMYWQFLGWSQLLAAFLLMTVRFSTLGAIIFFPIILNIFIITISLDFTGTPFVTGGMLLACIYLMMWDYKRLQVVLSKDINIQYQDSPDFTIHSYFYNTWMIVGILIFILTVICGLILPHIVVWFMLCSLLALIGSIISIIKYKQTNLVKIQSIKV